MQSEARRIRELVRFVEFGAGEGIRTLDPNLGKSQLHYFPAEPHVTSGPKISNRREDFVLFGRPGRNRRYPSSAPLPEPRSEPRLPNLL